jgi:hypothetical protein
MLRKCGVFDVSLDTDMREHHPPVCDFTVLNLVTETNVEQPQFGTPRQKPAYNTAHQYYRYISIPVKSSIFGNLTLCSPLKINRLSEEFITSVIRVNE